MSTSRSETRDYLYTKLHDFTATGVRILFVFYSVKDAAYEWKSEADDYSVRSDWLLQSVVQIRRKESAYRDRSSEALWRTVTWMPRWRAEADRSRCGRKR